jgi:hypothetical protein
MHHACSNTSVQAGTARLYTHNQANCITVLDWSATTWLYFNKGIKAQHSASEQMRLYRHWGSALLQAHRALAQPFKDRTQPVKYADQQTSRKPAAVHPRMPLKAVIILIIINFNKIQSVSGTEVTPPNDSNASTTILEVY